MSAPPPSAPSALSALSTPFALSVLSTLSAFSAFALPWLFPHTPTPGRYRLIEWNQRVKKASSSEEMTPLALLPSIEHLSLIFFPSSHGQKKTFEKAFNISCRLLARDHNTEEVDLSFTGCQYSPAIKANRK